MSYLIDTNAISELVRARPDPRVADWFDRVEPELLHIAVHLARRHPNVHLDLSGIPPKNLLTYFPKLESIASKCLFGTDWPSPGVRSIAANARAFRELPLSEGAKARILSANADALFPPRDTVGPSNPPGQSP